MSNYIPEDMQDLVKELVIYQEQERQDEIEEEILNRVYLEIMPEEPEDINNIEKGLNNMIIIQM